MLPTLKPGTLVWVFHWAFLFNAPKPGDIVVFRISGEVFVKRVEKVSDNQVYLVGDNPEDSLDSRKLGAISLKNLVGKVIV